MAVSWTSPDLDYFELSLFSIVHCPSATLFLSWLCFLFLSFFPSFFLSFFCLSKILISLLTFVTSFSLCFLLMSLFSSYFLSLRNSLFLLSFILILIPLLRPYISFPSLWPLFLPSAFPLSFLFPFLLHSRTIWRFLQSHVKPRQQKITNIRISILQRGSDITLRRLKLSYYRNRLLSFNH